MSRDRTIYPAGTCIECGGWTARMPLCTDCVTGLYENDGDTWENKDASAQALRDRASQWTTEYRRDAAARARDDAQMRDDDRADYYGSLFPSHEAYATQFPPLAVEDRALPGPPVSAPSPEPQP